ncbi:hypothetical protein [Phytomonospora endophytica]|uniref:Uncharacterized protein n=1 Tax=Phytomonospora endophytica TaxID=714109 RepID=A0A841FLW1_9ACTN|nr:hypothetical protein [Phytomonospora endophytica]MBB6038311.1 hypothetical protein [Phytomonospora endophytica]GIG64242.1 hypothetical protein Pen01_05370 [Phytomonospora endophytica]
MTFTATPASATALTTASRPATARLGRVLVAVNLIAALLATGSAVLALVDPAILGAPAVDSWLELYAYAYAARAVPVGFAVGAVLLVAGLRTRPAVLVALTVAGVAQVGDLAIGAVQGIPGMMAGSAIGAVIHLASVAVIARRK